VSELISSYPYLAAIAAMLALGAVFGSLLGFASVRFRAEGNPIADEINAILPQTQCGQCGYPGCRPYAEAIAAGEATINRCPPGGEAGIQALADLLDIEPEPLDAEHGVEAETMVAHVIEEDCIGCTKCIQACPVDAIIGAAKQMHTVVSAECTGCDLCVEPCPVDCIEMRPLARTVADWHWELPDSDTDPVIIASDAVHEQAA
jgi:electron transport complex protein RnfB